MFFSHRRQSNSLSPRNEIFFHAASFILTIFRTAFLMRYGMQTEILLKLCRPKLVELIYSRELHDGTSCVLPYQRNRFWQLGAPFKRRWVENAFNFFISNLSLLCFVHISTFFFHFFPSFVSYRLDFCFHSQVFITKFTLLLPLYHLFEFLLRLFALVKSVSS